MRLDYYEDVLDGNDVLLMSELSAESVSRLRDAVAALGNGRATELRIDEYVGLVGGILGGTVGDADEGVTRLRPGEFRCLLTPAAWRRVAHLLEPFLEMSGSDGFQYLVEAGKVEWVISTNGEW